MGKIMLRDKIDLSPIFCSKCGNRIGWAEDGEEAEATHLYCDDCSKVEVEEDEEEEVD